MEFDSLGAFADHLANLAASAKESQHQSLEKAAKLIEETAKDEFGHYQPAAGPFPAWAELADATKTERAAQGYAPNEPLLRSGELRDSISHTVDESEALIGSPRDEMVYQELGTCHIPPRPVLGPAGFRSSAKVQAIFAEGLKEFLLNGLKGGKL